MYDRTAEEPEGARLTARAVEALEILDACLHALDRRPQGGDARSDHECRARVERLGPIGVRLDPEIAREVGRTERKRDDPRVRACDLGRPPHASRRLDPADDANARVAHAG